MIGRCWWFVGRPWILLLPLLLLVGVHGLSLYASTSPMHIVSRATFLQEQQQKVALMTLSIVDNTTLTEDVTITSSPMVSNELADDTDNDDFLHQLETIPLQFLPRAGCLAVPVTLWKDSKSLWGRNLDPEFVRYLAVLDTGSPFLTAPPTPKVLSITRSAISSHQQAASSQQRQQKESKDEPLFTNTQVQYGSTVGTDIAWQCADRVQLGNTVSSTTTTILAVVSQNLVEDTGGLFVGLMPHDNLRPAILEQLQIASFRVDYPRARLTLARCNNNRLPKSLLDSVVSPSDILSCIDLNHFGPNLYHYAIRCTSLVLQVQDNETTKILPVDLTKLHRPVVVVIDTGLTGCILSDSWKLEGDLPCSVDAILGMTLGLGRDETSTNNAAVTLTSDPHYWVLDCFRLPWFPIENDANTQWTTTSLDATYKPYPHIIAAGGTFLQKTIITVDTTRRQIGLEQIPPDDL